MTWFRNSSKEQYPPEGGWMAFNNGEYVASDLMVTLNTIEEALLLSCFCLQQTSVLTKPARNAWSSGSPLLPSKARKALW